MLTPIRVAYCIDNLSRAGTESQLLALLANLDRTRVEPSLILLDGMRAESRELEPRHCEVVRLGVTRLLSRRAIGAARRLRAHWRARPPEVLQSYFLDASYFSLPLAAAARVPVRLRVRNNLGYWLTRKHRLMNRLVNPFVTSILTNSDAGRDAIASADRVPVSRIEVIENGVDLARFARLPQPAENNILRVGCVANLRAVKNLDGLLRAAALVRERFPDVQFEIAGEGPDRAALEALRETLQLGETVHFRGVVSEIPEFLGACDLCVMPSHSEGMSNAVLEYLAAGRAVVATDVGANATLIGEAGAIVPPGDDSALSVAMIGLLANRYELKRRGQLARERVQMRYSRAGMCRRFEDLYERLVSSVANGSKNSRSVDSE